MIENREPTIDRLLAPFREFAHTSVAGGVVLFAAAVTALAWANSPWASSYAALWGTQLTIGVAGLELSASLLHWINDGLMAIFFLVVGLEIKREVLVGELASMRRATLPIVAAVGGAIVPAILFLVVVPGGDASRGWGVPMATDIAFSLGVLALLGSRAPLGLRIFLTALAIADDLLAVLVIALFYTSDVSGLALGASAFVLMALIAMNRLGVRRPVVYAVLGFALWFAVFESGIHATVAGVLLALTIPATTRIDERAFVERARALIGRLDEYARTPGTDVGDHHAALWELEEAAERAQAPMMRMEHGLHQWVAFVIVPLFALANAGVTLSGDIASTLLQPIPIGIVVGLVVGKQVGITAAAYLVVRLGLASLPTGVGWRHIYGAAWLAGIGFTMSLFIGSLAYGEGPMLDLAKVGTLAASIAAGVGGYLVLRLAVGAAGAQAD